MEETRAIKETIKIKKADSLSMLKEIDNSGREELILYENTESNISF